jgi:hypothetical protein
VTSSMHRAVEFIAHAQLWVRGMLPTCAWFEQGQTDLVEPWYSTHYSDEAIPAGWMASFQDAAAPPELHLPLPNPFISSDFALIKVWILVCAVFHIVLLAVHALLCMLRSACMPAPLQLS